MIEANGNARPAIVALLSGGVDSAVMLGMAVQAGEEAWPLYVRQGFVWEDEEIAMTQRFLESLKPRARGTLHDLSIGTLLAPNAANADWALDASIEAPDASSEDEAVYLPGRNVALLTQAAVLAASQRIGRIQLGILHSNPFPDATDEFFRAFERCVSEALRWPMRVETPLARLTKSDVIERGAGMDLGLTLSCLRPSGGVHCGRCNKCEERRRAFAALGLADPARFAAPSPLVS